MENYRPINQPIIRFLQTADKNNRLTNKLDFCQPSRQDLEKASTIDHLQVILMLIKKTTEYNFSPSSLRRLSKSV